MTLHQSGQMQEAEKAYRKVLRHNALHPDSLRLLGALYLQTGQITQAAEVLSKAANMIPNDTETLTNLGLSLWRLKRSEEAAQRFEQALAIRPDYFPALSNLAHLYHANGNEEQSATLYEKTLHFYPDDPSTLFNYGNSLLASGKLDAAIEIYERALRSKPDYPDAMINLGIAYSLKGKAERSINKFQAARQWLEKAAQADPHNLQAMNNLGIVLRLLGETESAVACFQKALAVRPDYAEALTNLATCLHDLGEIDEAIACCGTILSLKPDAAEAHINLGVFLQQKGAHQEALSSFTKALRFRPRSIDAAWNKALSLLALGHYKEAWALHEAGLGIAHMRGPYTPDKRWQGEDLAGKRLLICCEQGLGDNLQFVRYAALCKERGANVLVQCPESLRALLSNSPSIDVLPKKPGAGDYDLHIPIMSLPYMFGTEIDTIPSRFPYLHVGANARQKWAPRFDMGGFKVGLVWAGNPREDQINAHLVDRRRSMDLADLLPLFDVEKVTFYNLQMGAKAGQIDDGHLQSRLIDWMKDVRDFEDTAAIVEHLDLVISVDTSVVHLAGGMGKPVWVLSRFDACWRWLQNRPSNPWYPSARVFGQQKPGDWQSVIVRVKEALQEVLARAS